MSRKQKANGEQKRHTHATINGIEDAIANLINVIGEAEVVIERAKRALGILQDVRQGPHSYQRGSARKAKISFIRDDDDESEK